MSRTLRSLTRPPDIAGLIGSRRPVVFLDYDGTLTPITARPDLGVMGEDQRAVVRDLADQCPVVVVSGRDRADVEALVGIKTLSYVGSHGYDIAGPGGLRHSLGAEYSDLIDAVKTRLGRELADLDGVIIEPKRFSVAAHYRLVAADRAYRVEQAIDAILADHDQLKKTDGKMMIEVQPAIDWHKGSAVVWLLDALRLNGDQVVAIYMGDDITDEDAFEALATQRPGAAIGIHVGDVTREDDRPTHANFYVNTPTDVGRLLTQIASAARGNRAGTS